MSELIDRKELLKCFCITKDGKRIPEVDCDNHEITISIKDIKKIIREQPIVNTRTPMDNIVEKLKENSFDMSLENPDCKAIWTDKAINIVKQEINKEN
jgi:hypothetical protein